MKMRHWGILLAFSLVFSQPVVSWASETDVLLKKLVQKGILTQQEAKEVKEEMAQEAAQAKPSPTSPNKEEIQKVVKETLPEWVRTTQWSGDLRLRHETQMREPATDRQRERFRLRFGFTTKPWDPLEIGVRIATGASGDPVSTNQSFTSTFDKKTILLDKAYAKYTPWNWITLVGGKMDNPFDAPTEIVWDADVTPEGAAIQLKCPHPGPIHPFLNVGAFQISELSGDEEDPALFGFQGGAEVKLPSNWSWQSSVGYYDFTAIKGTKTTNVTNAPAGNSTITEGVAAKFQNDYNVMQFLSKLAIPDVLGQPVAFIGDWTHNPVADDDNGAWQAGLEVGKVTDKFGSWKASYFYKRVEPDAVFGAITDSDFGAGGTNHKGHRIGLQVGLNKYASLGLTYYRTDEVEGSQNKVDTLQADAVIKY